MIQLGQHIEYLLMRHDCVVVPGLGAFLVHYAPAHLDADTLEFIPPSRTVGFNPEVNINDGLLADSVMRRHGLNHRAALDAIAEEVTAMRRQIEISGDAAVGRVGILHRGADVSTPIFEPLSAEGIVSCYRGLPVVEAPLIDRKPVAEADSEARLSNHVSKTPRIIKIGASAAAAVCLGIVLSTTTMVHGPEVNHASLDSGLSAPADYLAVAPECPVDTETAPDAQLYIAMPTDTEAIATVDTASIPAPVVEQVVPVARIRLDDSDPYLIIVASLSTPSQAMKYIAEKGDESLRYIEMDGNYRVYAATARTSVSGRSVIAALSSKYPSAWLCLK